MNWCKPHWDRLREAIKLRGLAHLGAQTTTELAENLEKEFNGKSAEFDPLTGCFWAINYRMLQDVGFYAMGRCPLCILVEDGQPELVDNWVNGSTDQALDYARENGLVPKPH